MKICHILLICSFLAISCSKKNYETLSNTNCDFPEQISQSASAYVLAIILNKSVDFREGNNGTTLLSSPLVRFDTKKWENVSITYQAGVRYNDLKDTASVSFYVKSPTLAIVKEDIKMSHSNPKSLKNLLCLGAKNIGKTNLQADSLSTFVVNYERVGINPRNNFYYSSAFGEQQGSMLQVAEIKEFSSELPPEAKYGLQVKYRINCKLYNARGEYVGDIKDAELVTKYYYEPIPQ